MRTRSWTAILPVLLAVSALVLGGCGGSNGGGEGTATVTGFAVDDGTMARVANAVAEVGGKSSEPTGADGLFTVTGVRSGSQKITVTAPGHLAVARTVALSGGDNATGSFYLPPVTAAGTGAVTGMMVLAGTMVPINGGNVQAGTVTAHSRSDGSGQFTIYGIPQDSNVQVSFYDSATGSTAYRYVDVRDGLVASVGTVALSIGPPPPPPT